ncbi:MAG: hypothetical protein QM723_19290 [Myxococcaceae bacterium]
MALLDGLAAIDWSRYHHAYGPANDVPGLLRALAEPGSAIGIKTKPGESVVDAVTWQLWGNVFHQGSRWGVSAKTIPFLVEIFRASEDRQVRRFIATYLHHLAYGYPTDTFPKPFEIEKLEGYAAEIEKKLPQSVLDGDAFGTLPEGTEPEAAGDAELVWMRDCYRGVESSLEQLLEGLEDTDDALVEQMIALVGAFPRRRAVVAPALWKLVREEQDSALSGEALVALAYAGEPGIVEAARVLLDASEGPARVYAAFAELLAANGQLSAPARDQLLEVPAALQQRACPFTGRLANLVNRALVRLPEDALDLVVPKLGKTLELSKGFAKLDPLAALLRVAKVNTAALTPRAKQAIALVVEHGDWGAVINANQSELLRRAGLPDDREALRKLIA